MLPPGTPVLVTWPGVPLIRGAVADQAPDGSVYSIVTDGGDQAVALPGALLDLRPFADVPLAFFSEAGWA